MGGFVVSWNSRTGIVLFSQIKVTQSEEIPTTSPQEEIKFIGKVDWVFKLSMPSASIILDRRNSKENSKKLPMLQLPKPKLSGSRDWLTNLFSPNKSRSNSSISLENKYVYSILLTLLFLEICTIFFMKKTNIILDP